MPYSVTPRWRVQLYNKVELCGDWQLVQWVWERSATMTIHQIGASYQASPSGPFLCDNALHPTKKDLICGITHTFTCMSFFLIEMLVYLYVNLTDGQETTVSWWPTSIFWQDNVKPTFWNEKSDTWFCKHLLELESGDDQPLKPKEFRATLQSGSTLWKLQTCVTSTSLKFLETVSGGSLG